MKKNVFEKIFAKLNEVNKDFSQPDVKDVHVAHVREEVVEKIDKLSAELGYPSRRQFIIDLFEVSALIYDEEFNDKDK